MSGYLQIAVQVNQAAVARNASQSDNNVLLKLPLYSSMAQFCENPAKMTSYPEGTPHRTNIEKLNSFWERWTE